MLFQLSALLFFMLISFPASTFAESEQYAPPEMPRSMINRLTEPIADIEVEDCYFARGKSTLTTGDKEVLRSLAKKLHGLRIYVVIEAYTDGDGSIELNQKLSEDRAGAAAAVIVGSKGLHKNQIITSGFGKTFATAQTQTDKSKERRIVITVLRKTTEKFNAEEILAKMRARGIRFHPRGNLTPEQENTPVKAVSTSNRPSLHLSITRSGVMTSSSDLSASPSFGAIFEVWPWWFSEDLFSLFLAGQAECGATYKGSDGTLSQTFLAAGGGIKWFKKSFISLNSSLTAQFTNYSFAAKREIAISDDASNAAVAESTAEEFSETTPSIGATIEIIGTLPRSSLSVKSGLHIMSDSLSTSIGLKLGGVYHW